VTTIFDTVKYDLTLVFDEAAAVNLLKQDANVRYKHKRTFLV